MIQKYSQHIGGTDRQDQNISKYRTAIREKSGGGSFLHGLLMGHYRMHDFYIETLRAIYGNLATGNVADVYLIKYGNPPQGQG